MVEPLWKLLQDYLNFIIRKWQIIPGQFHYKMLINYFFDLWLFIFELNSGGIHEIFIINEDKTKKPQKGLLMRVLIAMTMQCYIHLRQIGLLLESIRLILSK